MCRRHLPIEFQIFIKELPVSDILKKIKLNVFFTGEINSRIKELKVFLLGRLGRIEYCPLKPLEDNI